MSRTRRTGNFSLGLDFGTESVRAVLVGTSTGEMAGESVQSYRSGVMDESLPGRSRVRLPPDWALQDPRDYLQSLKEAVRRVLRTSGVKPGGVIGIGIDFTSCTMLPALGDGTPLSAVRAFRDEPHAWVKLWKHHAAQPQADRATRIALERREPFLSRYGGRISSEWMFPKILEILEKAPKVAGNAERFLEAQDWVAWQLTGLERRSSCAAGYKAFWSKRAGLPPADYFKALHPDLPEIVSRKMGKTVLPPGQKAGGLLPGWAGVLGLPPGTPVGVPIIDAHAAVLGSGVSGENEMVLCMGTSTCHLLLDRKEKPVRGMTGVVEDGIIPGSFGYEAGQAAVGDLFAWLVRSILAKPDGPREEAGIFSRLESRAARLRPGESGLLALDWWNGNRSILMDAGLSGLIVGLTLNTKPHEIYRALMEATAMGTRRIIQEFESQGLPVLKLHAAGGLAEKNPLLLQVYSDVTGREIRVPRSRQVCALGAAILGSVAAGSPRGHGSVHEAVRAMTSPGRISVKPDPGRGAVYEKLYGSYCRLHDAFAPGGDTVMKDLREIRSRILADPKA
ncbi:MAG: ribulokinase [Elusimicrobia bacterium RIFCSPLOWO2_01_FULL_64_13]|nr:MAG: ribulokinase [Elusimicrobia bacterium RIFCSPLOWO2_01_FULL_64_13]